MIHINVLREVNPVIVDYSTGLMREASRVELDNDLDYQGEMYRRYKYRPRRVFKVSFHNLR